MTHTQLAATFYPGGRDTAAIMASPDYRAWAEHDQAAPPPPPPPPVPVQTVREWSADPADTPMPEVDPRSFTGMLSVLSIDQIHAVGSQLVAGRDMAMLTTSGHSPIWDDVMGIKSDLSEAWAIAFERENPGAHKRQARAAAGITCDRCGASGQHLETFRYWTRGAGNEYGLVTEWHCTDIRACNERVVPPVRPLIISDELIAAAEMLATPDDEQTGESE